MDMLYRYQNIIGAGLQNLIPCSMHMAFLCSVTPDVTRSLKYMISHPKNHRTWSRQAKEIVSLRLEMTEILFLHPSINQSIIFI